MELTRKIDRHDERRDLSVPVLVYPRVALQMRSGNRKRRYKHRDATEKKHRARKSEKATQQNKPKNKRDLCF